MDLGTWIPSPVNVTELREICTQASEEFLTLEQVYRVKRNVAAVKLKDKGSLVYFVSSVDPLKANFTSARDRIKLGNVFDFLSLIMDGRFLVDKYEFLKYLSVEVDFANEQMTLSMKSLEYIDTIIENALSREMSYIGIESKLKQIVGSNLLMSDQQVSKLSSTKISTFSKSQIEEVFGKGAFAQKRELTLSALFEEDLDKTKMLIANYMKERLQAKSFQERIEIIAMMVYRILHTAEIVDEKIIDIKKRLEQYNETSKYLVLNKERVIALFDLYLDGLVAHLKKLSVLLSDSETLRERLQYAIDKLEAMRKTPKMSSIKIKDMLSELSCDENIECFMHSESLMAMFFDYKTTDIYDSKFFTKLDMCPVCESIWAHIATRSSLPVFVASSGEYEESSSRHAIDSALKKISLETLQEFLAKRRFRESKEAAILSPKGLSLCKIPIEKFGIARDVIKTAIESGEEGIAQLKEKLEEFGCRETEDVSLACRNILESPEG